MLWEGVLQCTAALGSEPESDLVFQPSVYPHLQLDDVPMVPGQGLHALDQDVLVGHLWLVLQAPVRQLLQRPSSAQEKGKIGTN